MYVDPMAYFDCLSLTSRLEKALGDVERAELHLFSYLACLLSLYKQHPSSDWGYSFAVTAHGYPYSASLQEAVDALMKGGLLQQQERDFQSYFMISAEGREEYGVLSSLSQFSDRERFLDGACSSLLALPIGTIRNAVSEDIDIKSAVTLKQTRHLLNESGQRLLYEQFSVLSSAIGVEIDDLMVPAVVWLTYLDQI